MSLVYILISFVALVFIVSVGILLKEVTDEKSSGT